MKSKPIEGRGLLSKLLEQGIKILLKKECKEIGEIKIDIVASSIQIIKGIIKKIHIIAKDINYKNLLFEEVELESKEVGIIFQLKNKKFSFKNKFIIKLKILLSEDSLKEILSSNDWNWIGSMITNELLNEDKLEAIEIKNDQLIIKALKDKNLINRGEEVNLKAKKGKIYLENKTDNKSMAIPLEEKIYIKNINIENNLIIILANSSINF